MRLRIKGTIGNFLVAKDLILHIIRSIGTSGASGYALEYTGQAVERLTMEGRMTLCNMSIEAGARIGLIAPDEKTLSYLKGRPYAPFGQAWDACSRGWLGLNSDPGASFDREVELDVAHAAPAVSWGIDPSQNIGLDERVPSPDAVSDERARAHALAALDYMGLRRGMSLLGLPVDRVFIGSCTNGRIEDLRQAAQIIRGQKVRVPTLIVPGSGLVKRDAEAEGLDRIFIEAGASWGEPGCSMCIAVNGDGGRPGERCVSTTNRNFIGRQGPGVRTHIANPWLAAAAAVEGRIVDYREKLDERTV